VEEDDAEIGALVVWLDDEAAVHVGMTARLEDEQPPHMIAARERVAALFENRRAAERLDTAGDDPEGLTAGVVVDRADTPGVRHRTKLDSPIDEFSESDHGRFGRVSEETQEPLNSEKSRRCDLSDRRPVAAPSPLVRVCADARFHGIPKDVSQGPKQLRVRALQRCAKAVLEEVGVGLVSTVEAKRIAPVERLHRVREQAVGRLYDQMEVVWHEAIRKALELVAMNDPFQATKEVHAIRVEPEDLLTIAPS
jgi:hypothetical protein